MRIGALGRTGARTSDQPFLIFCFFFIKEKEKAKGESPIKIFLYFKCVPNCFSLSVLLLDQKDQKIKHFGSPPGEMQPCAPGRIPVWLLPFRLRKIDTMSSREIHTIFFKFNSNTFYPIARVAGKIIAQVRWAERVRGRAISRS